MSSFNHFDERGQAIMVDVSRKEPTLRTARASAKVCLKPQTLAAILDGQITKGDVFGVARLAGIAAAKKTPDLIPLSHPLAIHHVSVEFTTDRAAGTVTIEATVKAFERTGVEMEAMTAASVAALTVYDMCKGTEKGITITEICLQYKEGGKSGTYRREEKPATQPAAASNTKTHDGAGEAKSMKVAILTLSDKGSRGERIDASGTALSSWLAEREITTSRTEIIPDDAGLIAAKLAQWADSREFDLILTTGGTGVSPRDVTPDATLKVVDRVIPGFGEMMRAKSLEKTRHAAISRAIAGIRKHTLIVNLPGSPRGAVENLEIVWPAVSHAVAKIQGDQSDCAVIPAADSV